MAQIVEVICCLVALCGNMRAETLATTVLICEGIRFTCNLLTELNKIGD